MADREQRKYLASSVDGGLLSDASKMTRDQLVLDWAMPTVSQLPPRQGSEKQSELIKAIHAGTSIEDANPGTHDRWLFASGEPGIWKGFSRIIRS